MCLCNEVWPVIHARFVRIRPMKWEKHIALRMELFGNKRPIEHQMFGQEVDIHSVCPEFKLQLLMALENKDKESKAIQIDCGYVIKKAMEKARCTSYGYLTSQSLFFYILYFFIFCAFCAFCI